MRDYPHVPAAFINAIAEEGTKAEAVQWLQKQWNETCAMRAALREILSEENYTVASLRHIAHAALK